MSTPEQSSPQLELEQSRPTPDTADTAGPTPRSSEQRTAEERQHDLQQQHRLAAARRELVRAGRDPSEADLTTVALTAEQQAADQRQHDRETIHQLDALTRETNRVVGGQESAPSVYTPVNETEPSQPLGDIPTPGIGFRESEPGMVYKTAVKAGQLGLKAAKQAGRIGDRSADAGANTYLDGIKEMALLAKDGLQYLSNRRKKRAEAAPDSDTGDPAAETPTAETPPPAPDPAEQAAAAERHASDERQQHQAAATREQARQTQGQETAPSTYTPVAEDESPLPLGDVTTPGPGFQARDGAGRLRQAAGRLPGFRSLRHHTTAPRPEASNTTGASDTPDNPK